MFKDEFPTYMLSAVISYKRSYSTMQIEYYNRYTRGLLNSVLSY